MKLQTWLQKVRLNLYMLHLFQIIICGSIHNCCSSEYFYVKEKRTLCPMFSSSNPGSKLCSVYKEIWDLENKNVLVLINTAMELPVYQVLLADSVRVWISCLVWCCKHKHKWKVRKCTATNYHLYCTKMDMFCNKYKKINNNNWIFHEITFAFI